jgi:hypothetical protein
MTGAGGITKHQIRWSGDPAANQHSFLIVDVFPPPICEHGRVR